jgi:hypothetical protein
MRFFYELQVVKALDGHELIDPYEPEIPPEESLARRQKGMAADFMIASSNAITLKNFFMC